MKSTSRRRFYAVITADVVGSRRVTSFRARRDRILAQLSKRHLAQKLVLSAYTVTAWDEFQVIVARPAYTPRVILDLRRLFFPMRLWIAVGMGGITGSRKEPINLYAGGEAFERAREAAEGLKAGPSKSRALTAFETGDGLFDTVANTLYHLEDSLLERATARQWATINAQIESDDQEAAAHRLRVDASTVSRNLKRGYYWQMIEASAAMERLIEATFPVVRNRTIL